MFYKIYQEDNDPVTSEAAINKFSKHLWYLVEESSALDFFNVRLDATARLNMVKALKRKPKLSTEKKLIIDHKYVKALLGKILNYAL